MPVRDHIVRETEIAALYMLLEMALMQHQISNEKKNGLTFLSYLKYLSLVVS